jgi:hypothetical protein
MSNEDDPVRETIESIAETLAYDGSMIHPTYFVENINITEETARNHLEALVDAGQLERYEADDGTIEYGPPGADNLTPEQISRRLSGLIQVEISEPHPASWFANEIGAEPYTVRQILLDFCEAEFCEVFETDSGTEPLFGRPGMDPTANTYQLRDSWHGKELVFPDGTSGHASTTSTGDCTVAVAQGRDTTVVFVDGEVSFTIDEYVKRLSPLSRSIAVSSAGYLAYHSGEHREEVFNLQTWDGESVIQRISESARTPSFTPDGDYVAYWRLRDNTIYCYDVEAASDSGQFDTDQLSGTNIGVEGVTYEGSPAFAVTVPEGRGEDELLCYISPSGDLLHAAD